MNILKTSFPTNRLKLKIIYLTQSGPDLPSVRFRVLPFVKQAQKNGHEACWKRIPKAAHKRLLFFLNLEKGSIIIIQKKLLSNFFINLLKKKASLLVFDFDDALWTSHPSVPASPERDKEEEKNSRLLMQVCANVDLVIAGNNYLADKIKSVAKDIIIIPTPLDTDVYTPARKKEQKAPVVGWMGTSCNLFFLPKVFRKIKEHFSQTHLYVVSDKPLPDEIAPLAEFEKWSGDKEISQLRKMDIGLMPLTDDDYTRGKCGFKLLQYMSCGVVPLASDVGFNRDIITHGKNGFLIKDDEWHEYVERLSTNENLRNDLAVTARKTVVENFSLKALADRLWLKLDSSLSQKRTEL